MALINRHREFEEESQERYSKKRIGLYVGGNN